jgi:cell division protein FtsN
MPVASGRSRSKSGLGARQLVFLSLAGVALLSLAFVLGMLVGRQSAREEAPQGQTEKGKRSALTTRSQLREQMERTGQLQEKLTFYQTLTAPLTATPSEASRPPAKPSEPPKPTVKLPDPLRPPDSSSASKPAATLSDESRPTPPRDAPTTKPAEARAVPPEGFAALAPDRPHWTVQVGAYRAREVAEELQRSLRAAGHDAYVTTVTFDDGRVHYRVRVGNFADRRDAALAAERLRSERPLVPFVTQK